jgi:xylulokinase
MYLGLDIGTSGVKAVLIDADQKIIGSANTAITVSRPHSGWSEQDPKSWISATEASLNQLKMEFGTALAAVKGIGLSGQMHGATLLDSADEVLRPCILWNDTRSHKQAAELDANPLFRKQSGNIVFPGFTAPKLAWVKDNEPEIFAQTAKVLLPKDYLRLWLTGEFVSDMSDASGTSWLNVEARDWSEDLLGATDLGVQHMPSLVEGSDVSGTLRSELASRWGMKDVVVAGGAGDNAASAIGLGTVQAGSAFASLGTSGVLFAANETYLPNPESAVHAFCHALPQMWHQMGVFLSATDSLNWWAKVAGSSAADLTASLGEKPTAPAAPIFLPYMSGERTPHNDAAIRGAFVGLDHAHDQAAMTAAVLDGVGFALRDSMEALRAAGTHLNKVMAVGGGSNSAYWLQTISNILGLPVELPEDGDFGAAFGAARLGLMAAENADHSDVCQPPKIKSVFEPNRSLKDDYETSYQRYRALYPALSGAMK